MAFQTILTQAQIDRYTGQGYWLDRVITDYLDEVAARTPDKVAAIDPRGRITYAELKRLSDRAALGLLELGIRPGDDWPNDVTGEDEPRAESPPGLPGRA